MSQQFSNELRSNQQCLQPLEFEDCLTDSPAFRENLKSHEKEIESCSNTIKHLQQEMKKLVQTEQELSKCHKHFSSTISNISFKPIGEQTEEESEIEQALKKFSELMDEIEDQRERLINITNTAAIKRLEKFRKMEIGRCKEEKRKFNLQTDKACSSLEKSLGVNMKKQKDGAIDEIDSTFREERTNLFEGSLHYVSVLHEIQERKKLEFVEALLQYMYGWMTFYHSGYEAFKEFKSYFSDVSLSLQNLGDTFQSEKDEADKLKERVSKRLTFGSTSASPDMRQGYLYSREKLAVGFGHSWSKYFCEYSSKYKTLNMRTYNQSQGRLGNMDQINVTKVVKKRPEASDRRFCFEVTSADGKSLILQALCEEDLKNWMEIMEGKEAHYAEPMQSAKLRVPQELGMEFVKNCIARLNALGLREQGIYRVSGAQTKITKLISTTFEEKNINRVNEIDDIKVIASALKFYFREILPEPLMTFKLHEDFLDAMKTEERDQKITNLKNVIARLPKTNYDCLKMLIHHLNEVAAFKEENLMHESNLGVVFGPTLMRPKAETVASIFNIKHQNILIENLIIEYDAIFEGGKMNEQYRTLIASRSSTRFGRKPKKDTIAPRPPSQIISPGGKEGPVSNPFDSESEEESLDSPDVLSKYKNMDINTHLYSNAPKSGVPYNNRPSPITISSRWPPEGPVAGATPPQKPAKTLQRRSFERTATALYDCAAENTDELSFYSGDTITDIGDAEEDGWCMGSCGGHRGLIPLNFIRENNVSNI